MAGHDDWLPSNPSLHWRMACMSWENCMFRIIGWGITCTSILLTQISQDLIILLTKVRMIMSFSSRIILTSGSGTLHLYLAHVRVAQLILCVYVPSRGPHLTVDTLCLCTNTGTASYCRYFVFMYQHGYRIVLLKVQSEVATMSRMFPCSSGMLCGSLYCYHEWAWAADTKFSRVDKLVNYDIQFHQMLPKRKRRITISVQMIFLTSPTSWCTARTQSHRLFPPSYQSGPPFCFDVLQMITNKTWRWLINQPLYYYYYYNN